MLQKILVIIVTFSVMPGKAKIARMIGPVTRTQSIEQMGEMYVHQFSRSQAFSRLSCEIKINGKYLIVSQGKPLLDRGKKGSWICIGGDDPDMMVGRSYIIAYGGNNPLFYRPLIVRNGMLVLGWPRTFQLLQKLGDNKHCDKEFVVTHKLGDPSTTNLRTCDGAYARSRNSYVVFNGQRKYAQSVEIIF